MNLNYEFLKNRQREIRESFTPSLALRTHRALSWLCRAEKETEDLDARFVFLWIAFNAAYANEIHHRENFSERKMLMTFLSRLIGSDTENLIYEIVWQEFPKSIRMLIDNKYVFQPFWDYHNGRIEEAEWLDRFGRSKKSAHRALGRMDTLRLLAEVLDRLYTLRNQLVHGGATWNSSVNRSQISDGTAMLGLLVPTVIHLMMENGDQLWGDACYPVVD